MQASPLNRRGARFFFVLSQGRSGTAFLAHLLGSDGGARVAHEPWGEDVHLLGLSRAGCFTQAVDDMLRRRFDATLRDHPEEAIYGEVNSYLRYLAPWLRSRLDATIIHVARDGRDFVRSAWLRDVQTASHSQLPIVPADDDPWAARWGDLDRFQRICWIWQHTNRILLESTDLRVRLEDLISDYSVFREKILIPTGVRVDEPTWSAAVRRPRNTSRSYARLRRLRDLTRFGAAPANRTPLPDWKSWTPSQTESFWRICGDVMHQLGYGEDPAIDGGSAG
jgi:hypothetical protein